MNKEQLQQKLHDYLKEHLPTAAWASDALLDLKDIHVIPHTWGLYQAAENAAWVVATDKAGGRMPVVASRSGNHWAFRVPGYVLGLDVPEQERYRWLYTVRLEVGVFVLLVKGEIQ